MPSRPVMEIYYDPDNDEYLLQDYAEDPVYGYSVASGPLRRCSEDEMRDRGIEITLESLSHYPTRKPVASIFDEMGDNEVHAFALKHPNVTIELDPQSQIIVIPVRATESTLVSPSDYKDRVYLDVPCANQVFVSTLKRLLQAR